MAEDLKLALAAITAKHAQTSQYANYYDGVHPLAFASTKYVNAYAATLKTLRDNLCPIVVDALVDRMEIINFSSSDSTGIETSNVAWQLWQNSQMELRAYEVHTDAIKTGNGYLIVWADTQNRPAFYVQNPLNCVVIYDSNTNQPKFGAKRWEETSSLQRLNLYYPDRVEKYSAQTATGVTVTDKSFVRYTADGDNGVLPNPHGIVPLFEFQSKPVLRDAIPIQDALNKTLSDMMVAQEFAAFRQRWATGLDLPKNPVTGKEYLPFEAGVDRLWFSDNAEVKFGEFGTADLNQFLQVINDFRFEIARTTGTPVHYFSIQTGNNISGEALKTLESRFVKRIIRSQLSFGAVWSEAMRLALMIEGKNLNGDKFTVQWQPPEQRSEVEVLEVLQLKRDTLEVPLDTLREEYGYSAEDIGKFNQLASVEPIFEDDLAPLLQTL